MDLTHITSQSLRRVLSLTERKDELVKLVSELESEIVKSLTGATAAVGKAFSKPAFKSARAVKPARVAKAVKPVKAAKKPAKAAKGKRGGLKERILALLSAAGDKGLRVKDIASQLGTSTGNVSVWFSTTGRSLTTKLRPGTYAIRGAKGAPAAKKAAQSVKAPF